MLATTRPLFRIALLVASAVTLLTIGCDDDDAPVMPTLPAGGGGGAGGSDPCAGVTCDEAPPAVCVAEDTLRTYSGQGTCVDGACQYESYSDESCTDCCYGAEINLTGNPLGGGIGYDAIVDSSQATALVSTAAELLSALASATAGDIIYVDDGSTLDLTGEEAIEIPAGVTLASGRGRAGSQGALIECDTYAYPLLRIQGDGVRITGLRMRGPQPDILDHDYVLVPHSGAMQSSHSGLEVDNCELWAWGTNAVSLGAGALDAHVHHNVIHSTRRAGLGYGVVLNQAEALIEGNVFDRCRHHIAATGRVGTSYEAAYNLVLEHANGHGFDMHGARDFDKRETKAIWRFDEGQGDVAEDSSIGLYHHLNHCTLTSMDTSSCWVAGQLDTALRFDGADDHLECGNDSSLISEQGTIYFWLQAAALGRDADLVRLFQDASANYLTVGLTAQNRFVVTIEDGGVAQVSLTSDVTLGDTGFHHVAVTQDGNGVAMYLDGQPIGATGSNSATWSDHLSLAGAWVGGGPSGYFQGVLDEVRIYSRALDAEEVSLHHGGNPDIAGGYMWIHHNTFRDVEQAAIVVRGKPADLADIHHNWFHLADPDRAVRQVNAEGNFDVHDNHWGATVPTGTVLPSARAAVEPAFGRAPLDVGGDSVASTDAIGRIETAQWYWGDGSSDRGRAVDHSYAAPGRYLVRATVIDELGVRENAFVPVSAAPAAGTYLLDFWVKDSYVGPLTDFYVKQVLVAGQLVWEDDVAEDEGWEHVSVDVSGIVSGEAQVDVELRAQNVNGVQNQEIIELDVFWDDVELFGGTVGGGDFETGGAWTYSESSSSWSGRTSSREPHTGNWAYALNHPYVAACPTGAYAQITQSVPITPPELLGRWRFDYGQGQSARDESLYGNHGQLTNMTAEENWIAGMMGTALAFDGVDDRVDCGPAASLAAAQGSIMAWVRFDGSGTEQTLLELFDSSSQNAFSLRRTADGRLRALVTAAGAPVVDVVSAVAVSGGGFHHVAVTQDGSSVRIYLDGADGSATGTNGSAWTDHIAVAGAWLGAGQESSLGGALDEVSMLSYALNAAAVTAEFQRGYPLGVWSFDEGQGVSAADSSGNGHDGTLTDMDPQSAWVSGQAAGALRFDGTDDHLVCASPESLSSAEGTIEFWMAASLNDETQDLVNIFEDGFENFLLIRRDSSNRILVLIEDDDQAVVSVSSTVAVTDAAFHHVAVTQDGSGVRIYVDGEDAHGGGNNGSAWTGHLALTGMWIGGGHWSYFDGVLDEVRLLPRALRPSEVAARAGAR